MSNRPYAHRKVQKDAKETYGDSCIVCGSNVNPHSHHLIEYAEGGAADEFNIVVLCQKCHIKWHNGDLQGVDLGRF